MGMSNLSAFTSLLLYVFIGAYMRRFAVNQHLIKFKICVSFSLVYFATVWISEKKQIADETFFSYTYIFVFIYSVHLFYLLLKTLKKAPPRFVASIAECSFGIYLIHPFFLGLLKRFGITGFLIHPAIGIPVYALLAFAGSFLAIYLARKSKMLRIVSG